ncbi:MAG: alpha/beta fold hydrolase, partial [Ramlibacter sp.]
MTRSALVVLTVAALAYLAACAALFFFQRSLIYLPQPARAGAPASWMRLPADGAELAVSVAARDQADALVYFGGNAEDVSASLDDITHAFPGHAVYLMHYRGYGGSSGAPSEEALHQDALALFDKVHASHPNVIVMGRSLGTGVAMRLASRRPAARLVLVTPYDNLEEIAARQFPIFPVRWMLRD